MNIIQDSRSASYTRADLRRLFVAMPPIMWCAGFLCAYIFGDGLVLALKRASVFAICVTINMMIYHLVARPAHLILSVNASSIACIGMFNYSNIDNFLYEFFKILCVSVVVTVIVGLIMRPLFDVKKAMPVSAHPLADAEIDRPLPGR